MAVRFVTAQEVFDAFPTAVEDMAVAPSTDGPIPFLMTLAASDTPEDAITFCAYALDRREAVWWAVQCVRSLLGIAPGQEDAPLQAAEDWIREPEDGRRQAALRLGQGGDRRLPTTWLALAAAWSGGSIAPPEHGHVPAAPHLTARAARTAILVALARVAARDRGERLKMCLEGGLRIMRHQPGA